MSRYDDIIDLPRSVSSLRKKMSSRERASQFAPFAALTGYGDLLKEIARETQQKIALSEDALAELAAILNKLQENIASHPEIRLSYFRKDDKKEGGHYLVYEGKLRRIDEVEGKLYFYGGVTIAIADIIEITRE